MVWCLKKPFKSQSPKINKKVLNVRVRFVVLIRPKQCENLRHSKWRKTEETEKNYKMGTGKRTNKQKLNKTIIKQSA